MSVLDRHVARVRTKLALDQFLQSTARAMLVAAAVALAYVAWRTFTPWRLPRERDAAVGLAVATALYGLVVAWRTRPTAMAAATAIDDRLGLHEKFSTALHARRHDDPFAKAAVADAERAATTADLRGQFAPRWPKPAGPALAAAAVAAGVVYFVPPRNLFAADAPAPTTRPTEAQREKAKLAVKEALAKIEQTPKAVADTDAVRLAKAELQDLLKKPELAPDVGKRKALSALQDLQKATEQAQKTQTFADAKQAERMLDKLQPDADENGAVADAQKAMAKGDFEQAMKSLGQAVDKFDQMTEPQKADAARQMQTMANQLQKLAADPKQQKQAQQKLQQMGMNQQQARQAQKLMQQAAQGNPQAQQQLQQMAQQAVKQMNNGQGPTQQQQQQINQAMQQMQAQANTQQQAQQMQQAAQQMAQAMKQAAGQNPQQAAAQKQGQSQQGQQAQPGQQANAGQQPQPGQQPGQQQGQQQQQMQQAKQSMQQQMQAMQAAQQDADQVAAGQADAAQALADAQNAMNGNNPGQNDGGQNPKDGQNQNGGQIKQPGKGGTKAGKGHTKSQAANGPDTPYTVDKKTAPGQTDDKGRLLAGSLVKSDAPKGQSKAALQNAAKSAEQDAADEVDSDRISRRSQKAVRDYFGGMGE